MTIGGSIDHCNIQPIPGSVLVVLSHQPPDPSPTATRSVNKGNIVLPLSHQPPDPSPTATQKLNNFIQFSSHHTSHRIHHPLQLGCFQGLNLSTCHHTSHRIHHPLQRTPFSARKSRRQIARLRAVANYTADRLATLATARCDAQNLAAVSTVGSA